MSLPLRCFFLWWVFALFTVAGLATPFDDRVEALFRPPFAEQMALSPNGQRLAYTMQAGKDLTIMIMNVEFPGPKMTVIVAEERGVAFSQEKQRAKLRFLRWATSDRLVFAPTEEVMPLPETVSIGGGRGPRNGPLIYSPIMAVDADGRNPKTLVDADEFIFYPPEDLRPRSENSSAIPEPQRWIGRQLDIVGFAADNREQLIIQARGIRRMVPTEQFSLNINTGKYTSMDDPSPTAAKSSPRPTQVYDEKRQAVVGQRKHDVRPVTAWADGELAAVQRALEVKFPRRTVELLDWSDDRSRVLTRITGGSDPGRVYVYQCPENLVVEIFRRAPWLHSANLNENRFFEFDSVDGVHLSGYVTWPKKTRLNPPPVLLGFPSGFPGHAQAEFDPEAQVFADLGFVVVRLNHRSVTGIKLSDRAALQADPARVVVDDAMVVLEWLADRNPSHPFDRKRVATLGRGFGGYLAVRALQLEPEIFRCGLAIDAPMDLRTWLYPPPSADGNGRRANVTAVPRGFYDRDQTDWKKLSVGQGADSLRNPVFFLVESTRNEAIDTSVSDLRSKLKSLKRAPDYLELDPGFSPGAPKARAAVYRKIEEFFNLKLYDYGVKLGPIKEVK